MIPANYHLHSTFSYDGSSSVAEVCEAALAAGLRDIGFAEHLDFDRTDHAYGFLRYEAYAAAVADAAERYAGRMNVRLGIEFDFRREYGQEPRRVLDSMALDFTIGSVHKAAGEPIWTLGKRRPDEIEALDIRAMQADYFDEVEALARTGWCHVLGHFDCLYKQCPAVFGRHRDAWYWRRVEAILGACIERGTALEVNSHHAGDPGIALAADGEILARYRALGGRLLTIGSDAHRAAEIVGGYDEAEQAVREAGFAEVTGFAAGRAYAIRL